MRKGARLATVFVTILVLALLPASAQAGAIEGTSPPANADSAGTSIDILRVPAVGARITVHTPRETTTYFRASATCTTSATAGTPSVVSGYAWARLKYSISSGCSGTFGDYLYSGELSREACGTFGCWWRVENRTSGDIGPGTVMYRSVRRACSNNDADRWRSYAALGPGSYTSSGNVWLNCGR